jgi:23S rRNA (pseudouridine1915-N3)-methyltransferase
LKITLICVGGLKKAYLRDGFGDYAARLKRYAPLEVVEVDEGSASAKMPVDEALKRQAEGILKRLKKGHYAVALDQGGRVLDSGGFAALIERLMGEGRAGVQFIVGGPSGMHARVRDASDMALSLSAMTFSHGMARFVLAEQIYRAFAMIRGEPYPR